MKRLGIRNVRLDRHPPRLTGHQGPPSDRTPQGGEETGLVQKTIGLDCQVDPTIMLSANDRTEMIVKTVENRFR